MQTLTQANTNSDQTVKCPKCKGDRFVPGEEGRLRRCECVEREIAMERLKNSGVGEDFGSKRLDTFKLEGRAEQVIEAYKLAVRYVDRFDEIRQDECNWLSMVGQVGCGKTHLTIGIANELLSRNIGVVYMQYREEMPRIKQVITDETEYTKTMNRFKNAQVLVVDDLFKEAVTRWNGETRLIESDLRIIFELFNYRYFKRLPVIISSEYGIKRLLDLDEGLGSRIFEMCKGRFIEFHGPELNYRLTG